MLELITKMTSLSVCKKTLNCLSYLLGALGYESSQVPMFHIEKLIVFRDEN
jgi:hypothetical protein